MNYPQLRILYDRYREYGFVPVAFPCNQFGGQAPGTSQEEREFAWSKFGMEFPVFDKIEVNGPGAHPLYHWLRERQPFSVPYSSRSAPLPNQAGGAIEWNYVKFLVDRNGQPVKRYKPAFEPLDFENDLRLVLAGHPPTPPECASHPGRIVCQLSQYDDLPPRVTAE